MAALGSTLLQQGRPCIPGTCMDAPHFATNSVSFSFSTSLSLDDHHQTSFPNPALPSLLSINAAWTRASATFALRTSTAPLFRPLSGRSRAQAQRHAFSAARTGIVSAASSSNGASTSGNDNNGAYDYDFFCIGAGSGGVRAARVAAGTYGAKVGICEMPFNTIASDEAGGAGGTCVLRGCVPKKLFVYCSEYREFFKEAQGFGWRLPGEPTLDWNVFLDKKNAELRRLNGVYDKLLNGSGVDIIEGRGVVVDPHTVEVSGRRVTARNILIATGARAFVPKFEGSELAIISDHALELPEVPKSIAIIGGGYIAVEFAGIFANLGSQVHLVYRQDMPLRGFDEEVRTFAFEQYTQSGIVQHARRTPKSIRRRDDGRLEFALACSRGEGADEVIHVDHVMAATGRRPNVHNLGLEAAGVELTSSGAIAVDEYSQTTVPSIWAVGDVTDRMALTPVALMESMALTKTLFGGEPTKPDHVNIPTAVFSQPQIGTVGVSEEQAVEQYGNVDVYTSTFRPMRNTISGAEGRTLMKLVVAADTGKVVGCHMVGPDSAEIMQGMGVAVKMGVTKAQLDSVVGIHPSAAEEFVTMRTATRKYVAGKVEAKV
jgi:glutathione reductase (NADPH)